MSSLLVLRHELETLQIEINSNQIKMEVFEVREKPEYPGKNHFKQSREPTNPTPI